MIAGSIPVTVFFRKLIRDFHSNLYSNLRYFGGNRYFDREITGYFAIYDFFIDVRSVLIRTLKPQICVIFAKITSFPGNNAKNRHFRFFIDAGVLVE